MKLNHAKLEALLHKLENTTRALEKASIAEYVQMYQRPFRLMYLSFFSGIFRGFGMAVGFTIVGGIFLYFLGRVASMNLPIVGEFIAEIARIVQQELSRRAY